ncbi:transcriptional regulator [Lactococcus hodotermopsidis]|uniref:Transcriptional regulator n=1 Tax=Pseudolactococcus hodotermopsidis TaxID=2709157 RepID=A0A6A0BAP2_9LACT|nr:zinc-dependent MarR family transcriptional regulator [Lactococcus hodotermopsidis]GFH42462.1 transcriptional regulator [Lactococcus hodotermopsidis]
MANLSKEIDSFFTKIMQVVENKQEVLLGKCESGAGLTNTQEHILMLLLREKLTNAKLAEKLNISPAAVTKALKKLQQQALTISEKSVSDERLVLWRLSETGRPIAEEHQHHHQATLATYVKIADTFSENEQKVIIKFLKKLEKEF